MALLRRKRKDNSADGTMSLMEHLYELRRRLFFAVLGLLAGTVVGFIWYVVPIPGLGSHSSLGQILIAPYCDVPTTTRLSLGTGGCELLATSPFSALQVRFKAALMAGAVLSSPVWLSQLWGFVTPALYSKEKKFARIFVASAAVLLVAGALLGYWVIHEGLAVLLGFGGDITAAALSPDTYYSFLMAVLLIFGVSFLLPLLLVMLNMVGVVTGAKLAKVRRYAFFGLVVFAGLTVPGNDPLTMGALAIALCLLYELAVQICRIHDKRKNRRLAADGFGDLSDDEASPMPQASTALDDGERPAQLAGAPAEPNPNPIPLPEPAAAPTSAAPEPSPPAAAQAPVHLTAAGSAFDLDAT